MVQRTDLLQPKEFAPRVAILRALPPRLYVPLRLTALGKSTDNRQAWSGHIADSRKGQTRRRGETGRIPSLPEAIDTRRVTL